jgi:hypothetical protein
MLVAMRMPGMFVRVSRAGIPMPAEIAMAVMRDGIAAPSAHDAGLVRAHLIDAVRLAQPGINSKVGGGDAAIRQAAAHGARHGTVAIAYCAPVIERTVSTAFVVVERHAGPLLLVTGIEPFSIPANALFTEPAPSRLSRNRHASAGLRRWDECRIRTCQLEWRQTRRHSEYRQHHRCDPRPARSRG